MNIFVVMEARHLSFTSLDFILNLLKTGDKATINFNTTKDWQFHPFQYIK